MPSNIRREVALIKGEATYGVGAPAVVDAQLVWDLDIKVANQPGYSRHVCSNLMGRQRVNWIGGRHQTATFRNEIRGGGADLTVNLKPLFHDMLLSCGFVGTWNAAAFPNGWSYVPAQGDGSATGSCGSLQICAYQDGISWFLTGGRGTGRWEIEPRKPTWGYWEFTGRFMSGYPASASVPTPDYAGDATHSVDVAPVVVASTGFTPFTWNPTAAQFGHVKKVTLDFRSQVELRESMTLAAEGLGVVSTMGHGTKDDPGCAVTLEVEQPDAVSNASAWYEAQAGQTISASTTITLGSVAGNTLAITFARLHVINVEQIKIGSRWGHRVECRPMLSAAATTEDDVFITAT